MNSKATEIELRATGLEQWMLDAIDGFTLLLDGLAFDPATAKLGADMVGEVVSQQLQLGNQSVFKTLDLGFKNMRSDKLFFSNAGKPPSKKLISVMVAVNHLQISEGIKKPSQTQVRRYLLTQNIKVTRGECSKYFKALNLGGSDARRTVPSIGQ